MRKKRRATNTTDGIQNDGEPGPILDVDVDSAPAAPIESCDQEDDIDTMDDMDFGNPFEDSSLEDDPSGNEDDCASDGQSEASEGSEKSVYELLLSCVQEDELHREIFDSETQDAEQLEPMVSEPASSSNQAPAHGPGPSPPEPVEPVAPEPPFFEGVAQPRAVEMSERKPAAFVSKPKKDKDLSMDIDGKGDLRYNKAASHFTAYSKIPGHGHDCRRSRTSTSPKGRSAGNNPFQGRPVGLLAAWIRSGDQYETASAHKQGLNNITYELRVAARAHVETLPGSADLLSQERTRFPGEILEPPVIL